MRRKTLLFSVSVLLSCLCYTTATARNAFAYGLSSELSADQTQFTLNYSLNDTANSATLVFFNGVNQVKTVILTDTVPGSYIKQIDINDLPSNVTLTWSVVVNSDIVAAPTVDKTVYSFYHSQGVAVDKNYESPYYGRIYATESYNPSKTGYHSSTLLDGLYVFDPQLQPVTNENGNYGFLGGQTFPAKFTDGTTTSYAPRKVRVTEDGRVFITGQNDAGCCLWEVDPSNMNANFTKVISGTQNAIYEFVDGSSNFIAAPNVGFDVKGSGENLKLLMLSGNKNGIAFAYSGYRIDEYNLGTATTWTTVPSSNIAALSGKYTIASTNASVTYDNEGGVWYSQARAAATDEQPSLVHVNSEGVEDFFNGTGYNRYGGSGIAFNKDFTKLAIGEDRISATQGVVRIYTVSKDADGKPVLTKDYDVTTCGRNNNDICWDMADNLYVVNSSNEKLEVFALPRTSGDVATPAASKYAFKIVSTGIESANVKAAQVIAGKGIINVIGEANSIEVYTITGILVSRNHTDITCDAGIYLVRVDGQTTKVVVK